MLKRMGLAGAAFAAVVIAQGAGAAPDTSVTTLRMQVPYGDLNLATPEGRSVLRARVEAAAAKACGSNPVFDAHYREAPAFVRSDFETCRAAALGEANARLRDIGVQVVARR